MVKRTRWLLGLWLVILFAFGCASPILANKSTVGWDEYETEPERAFGYRRRACDRPSSCYRRGICGRAPYNNRPGWRIINGQDQNYGEFPSFVELVSNTSEHVCGGVLVSDQHVLTAAHCMFERKDAIRWRMKSPDSFKVRLAPHYYAASTSPHHSFVDVSKICIADIYESKVNDYDWALLTLTSPVAFHNYVQPACLPYRSPSWYTQSNSLCFVTGLGLINVQTPPALQKVPDVVQKMHVTQVACDHHPADYESRFCWRKLDPPGDPCQGDSGGPVLCYMKRLNRWTAVGLVSSGSTNCDFTPTTSYVRLPLIYEQIERQCGLFRTSTPGCLLRAEAS